MNKGLLVTGLIATLATAFGAANYDVNPTIRASWPNTFPNSGVNIAASGKMAYLALGPDGFAIIDFTTPASPKEGPVHRLEGSVDALIVAGSKLFVTDQYAGLHIYDISDAAHPVRLSTTPLNGPSCDVAVSGSFAYVTAKHAGLHILNISDPAHPFRVGGFDTPGTALGVAVEGTTAYVADFDSGLVALNVTDPAAPIALPLLSSTIRTRRVAAHKNYVVAANLDGLEVFDLRPQNLPAPRLVFPGNFLDISIAGDSAYLIDNPRAMRILELPETGAPKLIADYPGGNLLNGIAVAYSDGFAFVAENYGTHALDVSNPASPIESGFFEITREVSDATMVGTTAFVLHKNRLNVVDFAMPENAVVFGSAPAPGGIRLKVKGNIAAVTLANSQLGLYDISDLQNPRKLSQIALTGEPFAVTLAGDYAYATGLEAGLQIIDITDPAAPTAAGSIEVTRITGDTVVVGDLAYVGTYEDGLHIFNVSNPASIQFVGKFNTLTGLVRSVAVRDNKAFLATDGGFLVVDVSNPASPQLIYDDHQLAGGFSLFGDTVYLSGIGLRLVDISDPAQPKTKLATSLLGGNVVGVHGQYVYLTTGSPGMIVAEFIANPQRMSRFPAIGETHHLVVQGRHAFLAGKSAGLRIVDVNDSANPLTLGQQSEPTERVLVRGNRAFAVGANGFRIIDISTPASPVTVGSVPGPAVDIAISGQHAYITTDENPFSTLRVIDFTDEQNPSVVKTQSVGGSAIAAANNLLFVSDYGVRIFNISDPANPQFAGVLGNLSTGYSLDVAVRGNLVYLAAHYLALVVIDASDPANPWEVGRSEYSGASPMTQLTISGDYAYMRDGLGGLHVYDITKASRPRRVGGNVQVNVSGLFASEDTLYLGEGANGLTILDLYRPDAFSMRLTALAATGDGVARVRATGPAGQTVQLERFKNGKWEPWKPLTSENKPIDFLDPEGSANVQFYRIAAPNP